MLTNQGILASRRRRLELVAISALLLVGCSGGPEPTYPVHGVVTLDDQPLDGGTILFELAEPPDRGERYTARGTIDSEGRYQLSTFGENDGAVAGRHRVVVFAKIAVMRDTPYGSQKSVIPTKYQAPETTDLLYDVERGDNQIDIPLRSDAEPQ